MAISLVAFACIFGGTLVGMFVRNILPEYHVNDESKDAVKMGIGMIATMAALVLAFIVLFAMSFVGAGRRSQQNDEN